MAREAEESLPTADSILQNLSRRPNVRSTLILSRKDGTIIKATGSIAGNTDSQTRHNRAYSNDEIASSTEVTDRSFENEQNEGKEAGNTEPAVSPAQILAESIYAFVATAGALADSLGEIEHLADASTSRKGSGRTEPEKEDPSAASTANLTDHDVQLLRLRLKKQEIIIFPDPRYLCCVVQDLEKGLR